MRSWASVIARVLVVAALSVSVADAQTVALHHGDVDPLSAGWSLTTSGSGTTSGPVLDGDVPAWALQLPSSGVRTYQKLLTPAQMTTIGQEGWAITAIVRIPSANAVIPTAQVFFMWSAGFEMNFGTWADGRPFVQLITGIQGIPTGSPDSPYLGPQHTLSADLDSYHRYDLVFRVQDGSADLLVDGVEQISNYTGFITPQQPGILWFGCRGQDQPGEVREARFHHVELRSGNSLPVPALPASWGSLKALYRGSSPSPLEE